MPDPTTDHTPQGADGEGWIAWDGGECPVNGTRSVQVKLRAYAGLFHANKASTFRWLHGPAGDPHDIVAYRPVTP